MRCTSRFCPWTDSVLHTAPLADIPRFHEIQFHFHADDTQLYISFSKSTTWNYITNSIAKIGKCLSDINKWMSINRLKLNKDKTELLYLFSKYNPQLSLPPLRFGTDIIKPSPHARNIGAIFDTTMSMLPHVNNVCKSAFYHLRTISCIRGNTYQCKLLRFLFQTRSQQFSTI